jgi:hypothetical protein
LQNQVSSNKRFTVHGHMISVTSGVKQGKAVVVFGLQTGLEAIPVFTLEKAWRSSDDADRYVLNSTISTAEKFLAHYQEHHQAMTERVNSVFSRVGSGFIAPDSLSGRFPLRERK